MAFFFNIGLPLFICVMALMQQGMGHPSRMVGSNSRCNNDMTVGSVIMGSVAVQSSSNSVTVRRGGTILSSGDAYQPGETLSVSITNQANFEYLLQATGGGSFGTGLSTCSGTRVANNAGSLVMPSTGTVVINMGFASSRGTLSITPDFTLVPGTDGPTLQPSKPPSRSPTATPAPSLQPTILPSEEPTLAPTRLPTETPTTHRPSKAPVTFAPTNIGDTIPPSEEPTESPSHRPSIAPSAHPTKPPTLSPSHAPTTHAPSTAPTFAPTFVVDTQVVYGVQQTLIDVDPSALDDADTTAELEQAVASSLAVPPDSVTITSYSRRRRALLLVDPVQRELYQEQRHNGRMQHPADVATTVEFEAQYTLEGTVFSSVDDLTAAFDTSVTSSAYINSIISTLQASGDGSLSTITGSIVNSVSEPTVTVINSAAPSESPTKAPNAKAGIDDDAFHKPLVGKLATGIIVGALGLALCVVALVKFMYLPPSSDFSLLVKTHLSLWSCVLGSSLAVVSLVLVLSWATNGGGGPANRYLGEVDMQDNPIAWHAVLMVAAVFLGQVLLVNSQQFNHVFGATKVSSFRMALTLAFAVCLMIALSAAKRYTDDENLATFTTMHSWCGIMATVLILISVVCSAIELCRKPDDTAREIKSLVGLVRLSALGTTTFAVVTGIVNYLPNGACDYVLQYYPTNTKDVDPAQNYEYIPDACKIANGLAITVILAAVLTIISLNIRDDTTYVVERRRQAGFQPVPKEVMPSAPRGKEANMKF